MQHDVDRVLIDREAIAGRVRALAERITAELGGGADGAGQITLVPVLTGSFMFAADLMRHLPIRLRIQLMSVSSYPGRSTASRGASLEQSLTNVPADLGGHHVLVIDDILDSGRTLKLVLDTLAGRGPASVRSCVLCRKQRERAVEVEADYVAFDIPDAFVVGYGLDFDGYYRNLPEICTLKDAVVEGSAG